MSGGPGPEVPRGAGDAFRRPPLDAALAAVRAAWAEARARDDVDHAPFVAATEALADAARAASVPVTELLKAVQALVLPDGRGDRHLDFDRVRPLVGTRLFKRYYADG